MKKYLSLLLAFCLFAFPLAGHAENTDMLTDVDAVFTGTDAEGETGK